ncbi:MAG: hypothetical protein PHS66_00490 [Candidatus Omnitrophica bacterium]|nr:hypothetical protein [Candidatus Omnitrophota bacterium]
MIEKIIHDNKLIAIILRKDFHKEGISFLTDNDAQLQLGYLSHPAGHEVKPHTHKPVIRNTLGTHEVLFIKNGVIEIDFYLADKTYLESRKLLAGDVILLAEGGHGIKVLEAATIVEVKNGPYIEDKERFQRKKD